MARSHSARTAEPAPTSTARKGAARSGARGKNGATTSTKNGAARTTKVAKTDGASARRTASRTSPVVPLRTKAATSTTTTAESGRPYGGRSPDARREDRRRRLLDAGLHLYGTIGYGATTITDLCREAGVAPAKFYEEFPTRAHLLVHLCDEGMTKAMAALNAAVETTAADIEARSRAGLNALLHALLDDPRWARVVCIEIVGVSPEVEQHRQGRLNTYAAMILAYFQATAAEQGRRHVPETPRTRVAAIALVGAVNEAIVGALRDPRPPAIEEIVDVLTGMFVVVGNWVAEDTTARPPRRAR